MKPRLRPLELPRDSETAVRFRRDSFLVSYGNLTAMGSDETYLAWLRERSAQSPWGFQVVEDETGTPIGQLEATLRTFTRSQPDGYVNLYYVVPQYRGQGLGYWLHTQTVLRMQQRGCQELRLKVSESNHLARSFYTRQGFVEVAREPVANDPGQTALVLSLAL